MTEGAWTRHCTGHGGCAACARWSVLLSEKHPAWQEPEEARAEAAAFAEEPGKWQEERRVQRTPRSPHLLCTAPPESQHSLPPEESRDGRRQGGGGSEKEGRKYLRYEKARGKLVSMRWQGQYSGQGKASRGVRVEFTISVLGSLPPQIQRNLEK